MNGKTLSRLFILLAVFFAGSLILGTFFDLPVASGLYRADDRLAIVIGYFGFLLFFGCCIFFLGVLFRQVMNRFCKVALKAVVFAGFVYLYLSTAILVGAGTMNDQLFEGVFGFPVTFMNSFLVGSVIYIPLFVGGVIANGRAYDKKVVKKSVELVVIMTLVFLLSTYFNCTIIRPHYRLLVDGVGGGVDGFAPWYKLNNNGKFLLSLNDLISSHSGSFTSGHAMYGVLFLILFPSLTMVFPGLKGKERILMIMGGVIGGLVIIARMISGDNYLSDISLGALAAIKMCFSYNELSVRRGGRMPVSKMSR